MKQCDKKEQRERGRGRKRKRGREREREREREVSACHTPRDKSIICQRNSHIEQAK
jgi:hypothetical protein